ncbi:MAG: hypothetical protein Q4A06_09110 [Cardiobacteriaceae bacterium]|nr:hypothetical protein [Cardiobacteriaceae bacterium]
MSLNLGKSWRLLATPSFWVALGIAWLLFSLYLLLALQEYLAVAPMLAGLDNQPGATALLLGQGMRALQWLMVVWTVFFVARLFAGERQWMAFHLRRTSLSRRDRGWLSHLCVAWLVLLLLSVPFWLLVALLALAVDWDVHLLVAYALLQLGFAAYAAMLAAMLALWPGQIITAALLVAMVWLVLWLLPVLTSQPPWLVALLQWFSPFSHNTLLLDGLWSAQTALFFLLHAAFFLTWIAMGWKR